MKKSILVLALTLSSQVFAYSVTDSSAITTALPLISTLSTAESLNAQKAQVVMNDAQEYLLTGEQSPFLAQKINEIQAAHGVSADEAFDLLIEAAESLLN